MEKRGSDLAPRIEVFGERVIFGARSPLAEEIPRHHLDKFDLREAYLRVGGSRTEFIAAIAKAYPAIISSRNLIAAVRRISTLPVAICLETIDSGLRGAFSLEGIPFASEDGNASLPFIGAQQAPAIARRKPSILSSQAQRIALNLIAGRWEGKTATELAELTGKSRASVSNYLKEIEAIRPSLVQSSWKSRLLVNSFRTKDEILEAFEPYLKSPVREKISLQTVPPRELLVQYGAKLSGLSALPFFSDLSHDSAHLTIMMARPELVRFKEALGEDWKEAAWFEDAPLTIEVWGYPLDATSRESLAATALECVDCYSLYAEMLREESTSIRIEDAVSQLREKICQQ